MWAAGPWVRAAAAVVGAVGACSAHLVAVVTSRARGAMPVRRGATCTKFITALTCVAAIFFGYIVVRYLPGLDARRVYPAPFRDGRGRRRARASPGPLIYSRGSSPLVPALQSYWLSIHVTAMTLATGIFFVAGGPCASCTWSPSGYRKRVEAGKADAPATGSLEQDPVGADAGQADLPGLSCSASPSGPSASSLSAIWSGPGLGQVLGLGPGRDLGVHHLGDLRGLPARAGPNGAAWRGARAALHPAARLRQPGHQHARRAGVHHRTKFYGCQRIIQKAHPERMRLTWSPLGCVVAGWAFLNITR